MDPRYIWARRLMFIATFTAPFYFIFPTNFGPYELFITLSAFFLLLSRSSWIFPSKLYYTSLLLILSGYTISMINSPQITEAVKFVIQFTFILAVQTPVLFTLTRTARDFKYHSISLLLSLSIICLYYLSALISGSTTLGSNTGLFYGNYNNLAVFMLVMIIPSAFLLYHSDVQTVKRRLLYVVAWGVVVGGTILMFSTQSRRIYPAAVIIFSLIVITSFLENTEFKKIIYRSIISVCVMLLSFPIIVKLELYPEEVFFRFEQTLAGTHHGGGIEERLEYIRVGFGVILDLFPLGAGYNNYHYYASTAEPHNVFIEPFAEGGLLAGIGVLLFIVLILSDSVRKIISSQAFDPVAASFSIATLAFVIAHTFGTLLIFRHIWLIFILASIFCCSQIDRQDRTL